MKNIFTKIFKSKKVIPKKCGYKCPTCEEYSLFYHHFLKLYM